jgi:acetoin utilization deacetylase AcuC-like enzyme
MLTIYSAVQHAHRHAHVLRQGREVRSLETPERIESILAAIHEAELGPTVCPDDPGLAPVRAVHDEEMITFLATAFAQHRVNEELAVPVFPTFFAPPGQRRQPDSFEGKKGFFCTDMEVPIDEHTWSAALAAAHCAWTGAMRVYAGETPVYALCRPPGHHAGPNFMGGYCYLNNAAVAARALCKHGQRVGVLDIDYHHGNGTQAIFYTDPEVCYASLHIDPHTAYPFFAGHKDEIGEKEGRGTNWNVPLPPGITENEYLLSLEGLLERYRAFDPQWLVVSAGFDTYLHDPISTFQVTTPGFGAIGALIRDLRLPTLVIQEGGYHIPDLGLNVVTFLRALM